MARVKVEPGGKVLAGIVILGVLLFLFFRVKDGTSTQVPSSHPPTVAVAKHPNVNQPTEPLRNEIHAPLGSEVAQPQTTSSEKSIQPEEPFRHQEVESLHESPFRNSSIKIFFDFNRASINKNVYCIFDRIEETVRQSRSKNLRIVIEGNADCNRTIMVQRAAFKNESCTRR